MFEIKLQTNNSEENRMIKDLSDRVSLIGTLKEGTSILQPTILVELDYIPFDVNYMTIDYFGRKYFVTDIRSVRSRLVEIVGRVDVLSTYADSLAECSGIVYRQENEWNLYLNDGSFKVYQVPRITTKEFPSGFLSTPQIVLTTV